MNEEGERSQRHALPENYILFILMLVIEIVSPFKSPVMVTLWPACAIILSWSAIL
jgi:hypothetical protein